MSFPSDRGAFAKRTTQPNPWFYGGVFAIALIFAFGVTELITNQNNTWIGLASIVVALLVGVVGSIVSLYSAELRTWIDSASNERSLLALVAGLVVGTLLALGVTYLLSRPLSLSQAAPGCANPPGVVWNKTLDGTAVQCTNSGTLISGGSNYAEYDLDKIDGTLFDQTSLDVSVMAKFTSQADSSAAAALLVQSPQSSKIVGGYKLVVQVNGNWELQEPTSPTNMNPVDHGRQTFDPTQPVKLEIVVSGHTLYAYINGIRVTQQPDIQDSSPDAIGLMVQWSGQDASPRIVFSNFVLTVAR